MNSTKEWLNYNLDPAHNSHLYRDSLGMILSLATFGDNPRLNLRDPVFGSLMIRMALNPRYLLFIIDPSLKTLM
jgi:hypothetical protein